MEEKSLEDLKRLVRTLKILDWSEEDIEKVLKIDKKQVRNLSKGLD